MDPMLAMMGGNVDEEQMALMAQMLRGQSGTGGRLSTSTIEPVARQGARMQSDALGTANQIGLARYRNKAIEEQQKDREGRVLIAALAAQAKSAGKKDYFKLSDTAAKRFQDKLGNASAVKGLTARFQDDYSGTISPVAEFENIIANRGLGTEGMEKQAQWWGDWKKFYENPERHSLFGSALTTGEMQQWYASNINPNMDADTIRRRLEVLNLMSQKVAAYEANLLLKRNLDPEYVRDAVAPIGILPEEALDDLPGYTRMLTDRISKFETPEPDLESMSDEELRLMYDAMGDE